MISVSTRGLRSRGTRSMPKKHEAYFGAVPFTDITVND
jgi:hypothetical protein